MLQHDLPQVERPSEQSVEARAGAEAADSHERRNVGAPIVAEPKSGARHGGHGEDADRQRAQLHLAGEALVQRCDGPIAHVRRGAHDPRRDGEGADGRQDDRRQHSQAHVPGCRASGVPCLPPPRAGDFGVH
ncbi:MAG: hypothetical protein HY657_11670 [Acidobacteria bacterium]|nr:hypothetical protein [Acidobacteriota bacterium]